MTARNALLPVLMTLLVASAAHADIGGIGSPVQISNPPKAEKAAAAPTAEKASATTVEGSKPLLVIRFNQRHVYFDRALAQAVQATERSKPGAMYDVVSYVPAGAGGSRNARGDADQAVNSVVKQMQGLGVAAGRIAVSTQSSDTVTAQEIDIYVK